VSKDVPVPGDRIKPRKPALVQFTSLTLQLEAFVLVFAAAALYGLRNQVAEKGPLTIGNPAMIWVAGGVLFVVLLVLSRLTNRPVGIAGGTIAQVLVIVTGLYLTMMFIVAAVFVVMWVASLRIGARVDRERRAYDKAHPETAPNV
jgi:FtsH-binding integral membrane protein